MMWEYKLLPVRYLSETQAEAMLNRLGLDGWEMVTIEFIVGSTAQRCMVFKRGLMEPSPSTILSRPGESDVT